MLELIKQEANRAFTENGAVSNAGTLSDCLDLFATIGALRRQSDAEITDRFLRAYCETPDLAMKTLFYARDVRGGLGERRVFRTILTWLAKNAPQSLIKNLPYIAEYGRWDDLLVLLDTPLRDNAVSLLHEQLKKDIEASQNSGEISLLAKWLPSVNTSNAAAVRKAKLLAKSFEMTEWEYRKTLVQLRAKIRILENNLRERDYSFDYSKQPSKAMFKYRRAFQRNDAQRYNAFLQRVSSGAASLHTDTLMPYELVAPYLDDHFFSYENRSYMRTITEEEKLVLNATWDALPSFPTEENALAVVDTSGSMYWEGKPLPAAVALSLGLYFAEHNHGVFHNHFIEFSATPRLIELKGSSFADKLRYAASFNEIGSTKIEAVFDLVLNTAIKHKVRQSELPTRLIIISDMEFDRCVFDAEKTNFDNAKQKFAAAGYTLPQLVFWNVASRVRQQPVTMNEQGVVLVSGCTPRIFSMLVTDNLSPYEFMLKTLGADRYAKITA